MPDVRVGDPLGSVFVNTLKVNRAEDAEAGVPFLPEGVVFSRDPQEPGAIPAREMGWFEIDSTFPNMVRVKLLDGTVGTGLLVGPSGMVALRVTDQPFHKDRQEGG